MKKYNIISMPVGKETVRKGRIPLGAISKIGFGGFTPPDRELSRWCFGSPKQIDEVIEFSIYRPRLVGKLSGNIKLMTLRLDITTGEYELTRHEDVPYERFTLVVQRG